MDQTNFMSLPGDDWPTNPPYNPSYFSPAHFEVFANVSGVASWTTAVDNGYTFMSDQCSKYVVPIVFAYGKRIVRVPCVSRATGPTCCVAAVPVCPVRLFCLVLLPRAVVSLLPASHVLLPRAADMPSRVRGSCRTGRPPPRLATRARPSWTGTRTTAPTTTTTPSARPGASPCTRCDERERERERRGGAFFFFSRRV